MSQFKIEKENLKINGELKFAVVNQLLEETKPLLEKISFINLQGVTKVDSSALALLIEWKKIKDGIQFQNIPNELSRIAKLVNLNLFANSK